MQALRPADPASLAPSGAFTRRMSADEFYRFCVARPDERFELSSQGDITVVAPAGLESDYRNVIAVASLYAWARRTRRGRVFGPSAAFVLPSGATLSPDAAWISKERIAPFAKAQRRKFISVCPEFVVEVMSPSDRLRTAQRKMHDWIAEGAELGWLIDGDRKTLYIYRKGEPEPRRLVNAKSVAGEGPVAGFVLDLREIWEGI